MAAPTRASSAQTYAYEDLKFVPKRTSSAQTFAYENVKQQLRHLMSATAYAYERVANLPSRNVSGQATTYAYEKVLTADPNQLHVWNPETNQYDRVPWYVFNMDTEQWQQIV